MYKVLSKVLANIPQVVINNVIYESQSTLVEGR